MDLDLIAPRTVRSPLISLSLGNPLALPRAFQAISILVAPTGDALTSGLSLPIQMVVTSPASKVAGTYTYSHVFRRSVPTIISFIPREGGIHSVLFRELQHCRWYGALQISVAGDPLDVPD